MFTLGYSQGYVPEILFKRKQDGNLAFPNLDQLGLRGKEYAVEDNIPQLQSHLLQTVRMRAEDPVTRRIGHLRIPRHIVTDNGFQEGLERHVPSLVLFDQHRR